VDVYVYMLASGRDGTLSIGVTTNLVRGVHEHRARAVQRAGRNGHTRLLVWYESADSTWSATRRERQIKQWGRERKVALIEDANPDWEDLYPGLLGVRE
jgi:putative endonuclease